MTNKLIYLDNNATTKVDEKVLEAMMPFFKEEYANPSSMYDFSKTSSRAIKEARVKIRDFVNAQDEKEIIFTSCGSESANTAIRGVLNYNKTKKHIITSKVEHPCVLNLYQALEKQGYRVDYIGVNSNGELDLEELDAAVCEDTALVSIMWANNETGVINPIGKISEIVKSKNKDTKLFENYTALGHAVLDKSYEELTNESMAVVNSVEEPTYKAKAPTVEVPTYTAPPVINNVMSATNNANSVPTYTTPTPTERPVRTYGVQDTVDTVNASRPRRYYN